MIPIGGVLDVRGFEFLASVVSTLALWVQQRRERDPVVDLTERLRHPVRWSLKHPLQAWRRTR